MPAPLCESLLGCVWQFQTLITGIAAVIAAAITGIVIYRAAHLPIKAQQKQQEQDESRRLKLHSLALASEFKLLGKRARGDIGTIKVYIAANASVTDDTRRKMTLTMPDSTKYQDFMYLLPLDIVTTCVELNSYINEYNFDVARAGGAFGADNFRNQLIRRLENISTICNDLSNKFCKYA